MRKLGRCRRDTRCKAHGDHRRGGDHGKGDDLCTVACPQRKPLGSGCHSGVARHSLSGHASRHGRCSLVITAKLGVASEIIQNLRRCHACFCPQADAIVHDRRPVAYTPSPQNPHTVHDLSGTTRGQRRLTSCCARRPAPWSKEKRKRQRPGFSSTPQRRQITAFFNRRSQPS